MKSAKRQSGHLQFLARAALCVLSVLAVVPLTQAARAADTEISTSVGAQTWTGENFTVTETGEVTGVDTDGIEVTAPGSGTLTNRGTITADGFYRAINTFGAFGALVNSGTISSTGGGSGLYVGDSDGAVITNEADGVISGGIGFSYAGTVISVFTNAGLISGDNYGAYATYATQPGQSGLMGSIDEFNNSGTITGGQIGLNLASSFIGTFNNSGTISGDDYGIFFGKFDTFTNDTDGIISGDEALYSIDFDTLINRGKIIGGEYGVFAISIVQSHALFQNDGLISGDTAFQLSGDYDTILNNGTISSDDTALFLNGGHVDTLTNNGLIRGQILLIGSSGFPVVTPDLMIDNFTNSGTIEGDIRAIYGATLTINGGADRRGLLTGLDGAQGLIRTNYGLADLPQFDVYNAANRDLTFGSGLLLLNDVIDAGDAHVRFAGANVQINNAVAVTGNVVMSAGGMVFGVSAPDTYGHYTVTGTAALDAGTVSLVALDAPVFQVGQTYHVLSADSMTAGSITTSIAGYDTSYAILDMGGSYDFVVSVDGVDAAYSQVGFTTGQMLLNGSAPVISTIATHQDEQIAALGASGVAAGSASLQGRLWGKVLRADTDRETNAASVGYGTKSTGFVVGADMPLDDEAFEAGLALSWLRDIGNSADRLNGTDATIDNYQVTAYGTWRPADRVRLDGQLAYGLARVGQHRYVSVAGAVADADYDGDQIVGDLTASYAIPLGPKSSLTPYAGLRAVRVTADSYREQGAGIANLSVDEFSATSLRHDIGVKLATDVRSDQGTFTPTLRLGWLHEYRDTPLTTSGTFGVTPFAQSSARVARDGLGVGLGVELAVSDSLSVGIAYDGEYRSDYQSHTGSIKASLNF
ncbi:MAG: autotransporter domain-containing protein [Rhizobiales bacterium]|nr:autotransporter domain-containing protein [Hyphomicrobiales bacterium]